MAIPLMFTIPLTPVLADKAHWVSKLPFGHMVTTIMVWLYMPKLLPLGDLPFWFLQNIIMTAKSPLWQVLPMPNLKMKDALTALLPVLEIALLVIITVLLVI